MIDLEKMRKKWSGSALSHLNPEIHALRDYTFAIEALCREVEELRRELNNSRREPHFIQYKESK